MQYNTCILKHIYMCIHTHTTTHPLIPTMHYNTCIRTHIYTCVTHIYTCVYTYTHTYTYVYIYIYFSVFNDIRGFVCDGFSQLDNNEGNLSNLVGILAQMITSRSKFVVNITRIYQNINIFALSKNHRLEYEPVLLLNLSTGWRMVQWPIDIQVSLDCVQ